MATQEERVTTLEQTFAIFRKETAARTQEIEENTTIMLGVMRAQGYHTECCVKEQKRKTRSQH